MEMLVNDELSKKSSYDECRTSCFKNLGLKLKIIFLIICLIGFSYQVHQFLTFYWTYPVVMDLKIENNREFIIPAITYCYFTSAIRNKFCAKDPKNCYKPEKNDSICETYPDYCKNDYEIPHEEALKNVTYATFDDFEGFHENITNFMYSNPWNLKEDSVYGPYMSLNWYSFNVSVCYVLNSAVNSSNEAVKWTNNNPKLDSFNSELYFSGFLGFNLWERVLKERNISHRVSISVHSPFEVANPEKEAAMTPGNRYELHIRMTEINRLPPPYSKDCIDYFKKWVQNNRVGPRSQKACRDMCEVEYDIACFGCVNMWNLYPMKHTKCTTGVNVDPDAVCNETLKNKYHDCLSQCKMECSRTKYTYSIKQMDKDLWDYRGYHPGLIEVDVFVESDITVYTERPQYQYVELFGIIGGYLCLWLGVSLFVLIDVMRSCSKALEPFFLRCSSRVVEMLRSKFKMKSNEA